LGRWTQGSVLRGWLGRRLLNGGGGVCMRPPPPSSAVSGPREACCTRCGRTTTLWTCMRSVWGVVRERAPRPVLSPRGAVPARRPQVGGTASSPIVCRRGGPGAWTPPPRPHAFCSRNRFPVLCCCAAVLLCACAAYPWCAAGGRGRGSAPAPEPAVGVFAAGLRGTITCKYYKLGTCFLGADVRTICSGAAGARGGAGAGGRGAGVHVRAQWPACGCTRDGCGLEPCRMPCPLSTRGVCACAWRRACC
jgi:hypothetical protein